MKKNPIFLILDNVLDTYNVGSLFRLADAAGVEKVFLCGQTPTPPAARIKKASINTTEWVDWDKRDKAGEIIKNLKMKIENLKTVGIEQDPRSVVYHEADYTFPLALVVGNETFGVSREALDLCDIIVEIPLFGVNKSLNVVVSTAIVLYEAVKGLKLH